MATNGKTNQMNPEILRAARVLLEPGSVAEVRAFSATVNASGFVDNPEKLAEAVAELDRRGFAVNQTLNPVEPSLHARAANRIEYRFKHASTADRDTARRRWLLVDLDPERASGISATRSEKRAAGRRAWRVRRYLRKRGWAEPIVADSGNGYHLLYPIDLPNDQESKDLVEGVLKALDYLFSDSTVGVDTGVANAARVTKAYGSVARKGDDTADRPWRRSRLMVVPDNRGEVKREQLAELAAERPQDPNFGRYERNGDGVDVQEFMERHGIATNLEKPWNGGYLWRLAECPLCGNSDKSAVIIKHPSGAADFKCHHNHCPGRWRELREHFEPGCYDKRASKAGKSTQERASGGEDAEEPGVANPKASQADRLIQYALATEAPLFLDQTGAPHVLINSTEATPLNTRCYPWLRGLMWDAEGITLGSEPLRAVVGTLAAFALRSGDERELHTRAAMHEGALYYQLGPGRFVHVDESGWRIVNTAPVLFRSIPNLKPLPDPVEGGYLEAVKGYVNLKTERDSRMFVAYTVSVVLPHIPRPILQTTGVQGSGKTTLGRLIKRTLDPTMPEAVRVDHRDFVQNASHVYLLLLDNLNSLPEWAVDILCRLVTGEADAKRSLYTDDEDFIYQMRRGVILNGINAPAERGDIQDRTLPVELERIPDHKRTSEASLWESFEAEHPKLLGAIFGTLSDALAALPTISLRKRPRLADWGEYAAAIYEVMGWGTEQFITDWGQVVKAQNQGTLDGSPVAQTVLSFMEGRNRYEGSSSDLHGKLVEEAEKLNIDTKKDKTWPKSSSWLWRRLKEVLPMLAAMGIRADKVEKETGSKIILERTTSGPEPDPPDPGSKAGEAWQHNSDAARNAASEYSAKVSAGERTADSPGSNGSKSGQLSYSLLEQERKKHKNEEQTGEKTGRLQEFPENASTAASAASGAKRSLTEDEVRQVRKLIQQGMAPEVARHEVLNGGAA